MKRILAISGSRADHGLLEWPVKVLRESFTVDLYKLRVNEPAEAYASAAVHMGAWKPDCLLILGDRWEILQATIAAHLRRIPIAHICGGDITGGSYDDAMRDCITRLATYHFVTSQSAYDRLVYERPLDVHMVGNPAVDYILNGDWMGARPYNFPYVVVSYQAETIDGVIDWDAVIEAIGGRAVVFIRPNADLGSDKINALIDAHGGEVLDWLPHGEFLNLLNHCECFIGNSSAMLYEAPTLGVKCRMIGRRQEGRVVPTGDGKASERIREILCRCL